MYKIFYRIGVKSVVGVIVLTFYTVKHLEVRLNSGQSDSTLYNVVFE